MRNTRLHLIYLGCLAICCSVAFNESRTISGLKRYTPFQSTPMDIIHSSNLKTLNTIAGWVSGCGMEQEKAIMLKIYSTDSLVSATNARLVPVSNDASIFLGRDVFFKQLSASSKGMRGEFKIPDSIAHCSGEYALQKEERTFAHRIQNNLAVSLFYNYCASKMNGDCWYWRCYPLIHFSEKPYHAGEKIVFDFPLANYLTADLRLTIQQFEVNGVLIGRNDNHYTFDTTILDAGLHPFHIQLKNRTDIHPVPPFLADTVWINIQAANSKKYE